MPCLSRNQPRRPSGNAALPSLRAGNAFSNVAGTVSLTFTTCGVPSICAAWLRVMPVTENSSIPTRHTAALIQCHWCRVRSQ